MLHHGAVVCTLYWATERRPPITTANPTGVAYADGSLIIFCFLLGVEELAAVTLPRGVAQSTACLFAAVSNDAVHVENILLSGIICHLNYVFES